MAQNSEMSITKKMLGKIRESRYNQYLEKTKDLVTEEKVDDNFITKSKTLMKEAVENSKKKLNEENENENVDSKHKDSVEINKDTPMFGDIRTSQEELIKKTISDNVKFGEGALKFYPESEDLTLNGQIPSLNMKFQFRYSDPSGNGCYVWCDAIQLTDGNLKTIGKIKNCYDNWKDSITENDDLIDKLKKFANKKD